MSEQAAESSPEGGTVQGPEAAGSSHEGGTVQGPEAAGSSHEGGTVQGPEADQAAPSAAGAGHQQVVVGRCNSCFCKFGIACAGKRHVPLHRSTRDAAVR